MCVKRTRTGCLCCRRRHKKCDEMKPSCNFCVSKNITCEWPKKGAVFVNYQSNEEQVQSFVSSSSFVMEPFVSSNPSPNEGNRKRNKSAPKPKNINFENHAINSNGFKPNYSMNTSSISPSPTPLMSPGSNPLIISQTEAPANFNSFLLNNSYNNNHTSGSHTSSISSIQESSYSPKSSVLAFPQVTMSSQAQNNFSYNYTFNALELSSASPDPSPSASTNINYYPLSNYQPITQQNNEFRNRQNSLPPLKDLYGFIQGIPTTSNSTSLQQPIAPPDMRKSVCYTTQTQNTITLSSTLSSGTTIGEATNPASGPDKRLSVGSLLNWTTVNVYKHLEFGNDYYYVYNEFMT